MIKEYFANYFLHNVRRDLRHARATRWRSTRTRAEPWRVTLVDTGAETHDRRPAASASRDYLGDETFMLTYGDGVADVDIAGAAGRSTEPHGKLATVTAVQPPGRFGALQIDEDGHGATRFQREAAGRRRLDQRRLLRARARRSSTTSTATQTVWEQEPLERLAADGQLTCLPPRRLLAADGHAARQARARGAVGRRARRRGRSGDVV